MSSTYPGAVRSFTTKADNVDTVLAQHVNDLQDEMASVQSTLGVNPQNSAPAGNPATVKLRLDWLESNRVSTNHVLVTSDDHANYHTNARHDLTARHTFGAALGTPQSPAQISQTTAALGTGTYPPHDDHVHAQPTATPRGVIYVQTTGFTNTSTSSGSFVTVGQVNAVTVTGRRYRLSFSGTFITAQTSIQINADIQQDGSSLLGGSNTFLLFAGGPSNAYMSVPATLTALASPSAAAHSFTFAISATPGGGNAVGVTPVYFMLEDIGI